jgi:hypothetical protein
MKKPASWTDTSHLRNLEGKRSLKALISCSKQVTDAVKELYLHGFHNLTGFCLIGVDGYGLAS